MPSDPSLWSRRYLQIARPGDDVEGVPSIITVNTTSSACEFNDRWLRDDDWGGYPQWARLGNHGDKIRWQDGLWRICGTDTGTEDGLFFIKSDAYIPPKHGWQITGNPPGRNGEGCSATINTGSCCSLQLAYDTPVTDVPFSAGCGEGWSRV